MIFFYFPWCFNYFKKALIFLNRKTLLTINVRNNLMLMSLQWHLYFWEICNYLLWNRQQNYFQPSNVVLGKSWYLKTEKDIYRNSVAPLSLLLLVAARSYPTDLQESRSRKSYGQSAGATKSMSGGSNNTGGTKHKK